jgi:hypothetical protein
MEGWENRLRKWDGKDAFPGDLWAQLYDWARRNGHTGKCDLEAFALGRHRVRGCRNCGCLYYEANGEQWQVPPDKDEEPTTVTEPICYPPPGGGFSFVLFDERIEASHSGQAAYSAEWPDDLPEPRITHHGDFRL